MMKKSVANYFRIIIVSFTLVAFLSGCETQEILVPEVEFFLAKEWRILEAYRDGILLTPENFESRRGFKLV